MVAEPVAVFGPQPAQALRISGEAAPQIDHDGQPETLRKFWGGDEAVFASGNAHREHVATVELRICNDSTLEGGAGFGEQRRPIDHRFVAFDIAALAEPLEPVAIFGGAQEPEAWLSTVGKTLEASDGDAFLGRQLVELDGEKVFRGWLGFWEESVSPWARCFDVGEVIWQRWSVSGCGKRTELLGLAEEIERAANEELSRQIAIGFVSARGDLADPEIARAWELCTRVLNQRGSDVSPTISPCSLDQRGDDVLGRKICRLEPLQACNRRRKHRDGKAERIGGKSELERAGFGAGKAAGAETGGLVPPAIAVTEIGPLRALKCARVSERNAIENERTTGSVKGAQVWLGGLRERIAIPKNEQAIPVCVKFGWVGEIGRGEFFDGEALLAEDGGGLKRLE